MPHNRSMYFYISDYCCGIALRNDVLITLLKLFETNNVYRMITRPYNFSMTPGEGAAVRGTSSGLNCRVTSRVGDPSIYIYDVDYKDMLTIRRARYGVAVQNVDAVQNVEG